MTGRHVVAHAGTRIIGIEGKLTNGGGNTFAQSAGQIIVTQYRAN